VAWTIVPGGDRHTIAQTERVGSCLDGAVKLIDGRGYGDNGVRSFTLLTPPGLRP
jgi:hypothetical protein